MTDPRTLYEALNSAYRRGGRDALESVKDALDAIEEMPDMATTTSEELRRIVLAGLRDQLAMLTDPTDD